MCSPGEEIGLRREPARSGQRYLDRVGRKPPVDSFPTKNFVADQQRGIVPPDGFDADEKVNGKKKYVAIWLHKVKFTEGQESYKTKGDNIEYQTPNISGQAITDASGEWRTRKICDTEQDARDWIDTMAGIKSAPAPTAEGGN